ncbi:hypothetical protein A7D33_09885 [Candidatus Methylacidiphilum fumarolicum]|nr:hypothetical protein A7D33_09885 [Candidatus Methylacidiphilum fumarolicum]
MAFILGFFLAALPTGLQEFQAGLNEQYHKSYEEAIAHYTQAIDSGELSRETLAIAYNNRADIWFALGHYYKAISDYNRAIELNPQPDYFNRRGIVEAKLGQYEKAIKDYSESIRRNRSNAYVYNNRGWALYKKGNYLSAIKDFNEALRLKSDYALAFDNRGWVHFRKGEREEALSDLSRAIQLDRIIQNSIMTEELF